MPERQTDLAFDYETNPAQDAAPIAAADLRDEIAAAWGLPVGEYVEVRLRDSQCDAVTGNLELVAAPEFPWNPKQPLQLRIAGFPFSSRVIESWTLVAALKAADGPAPSSSQQCPTG